MSNEEIRQWLTGKTILVIEDDDELAFRLVHAFRKQKVEQVVTVGSVESGLKELTSHWHRFDLVIVDIMLPDTEKTYSEIRKYRDELKECRKTFMDAATETRWELDESPKVEEARDTRKHLLAIIADMIRMDAGISMIEAWRREMLAHTAPGTPHSGTHGATDASSKSDVPVFFLTAIGDKESKRRGLSLVERGKWLVKPVTSEVVLSVSAELIATSIND